MTLIVLSVSGIGPQQARQRDYTDKACAARRTYHIIDYGSSYARKDKVVYQVDLQQVL